MRRVHVVSRIAQGALAACEFKIMVDHHPREFLDGGSWLPVEDALRLRHVAKKLFDFCGPEIARINLNEVAIVEANQAESDFAELTDGNHLSGGDDVIIRIRLLQHEPHRFDVVASETPVAQCIKISEIHLALKAELDAAYRARDFARDKSLAATWALVIEENAA